MIVTFRKLTIAVASAALLGAAGLASAAQPSAHRAPAAVQYQQRSHAPAPAPRARARANQQRGHMRPASARYQRGGHVPRAWQRSPTRVVTHWRQYQRLYQPPVGYRWVRGDQGDALLVAVTTGVIVGIVAHVFL